MAKKPVRIVYCPHCETNAEVQKKGMSGDLQRLLCKNCGKTFYAEPKGDDSFVSPRPTKNAKPVIKGQTKGKVKSSVSTKSTSTTKVEETKVITKIYVNNSLVKEVQDDVDIETAARLVQGYFENIAVENAKVEKEGGEKIINFNIQVGGKG